MLVDHEDQLIYWNGRKHRRAPDHPAVRAFVAPKLSLLLEHLSLAKDARPSLLEVGAGSGHFSVPLSEHFELRCVDYSATMLALNPVPSGRKQLGDARALDFEDGEFDFAFCANLLHHLAEPVTAVRELNRVTRRQVMIIEPNAANPLMFMFGALKRVERGTLRFTASYLKRIIEDAGMRLDWFATHGAIVPNATPPLLLPLLERCDGRHALGFYHLAIASSG